MSTRTDADVGPGAIVWSGAVDDGGEHDRQKTSKPAGQQEDHTIACHERRRCRPDTSALPLEGSDARIGRERLPAELQTRLRKVAQGAGPMRAEMHAPGLTLLGLT